MFFVHRKHTDVCFSCGQWNVYQSFWYRTPAMPLSACKWSFQMSTGTHLCMLCCRQEGICPAVLHPAFDGRCPKKYMCMFFGKPKNIHMYVFGHVARAGGLFPTMGPGKKTYGHTFFTPQKTYISTFYKCKKTYMCMFLCAHKTY